MLIAYYVYFVATNQTNSQMVWGPCTYGFLDSDLESFYQTFSIPAKVSNVKREGFHGLPGTNSPYFLLLCFALFLFLVFFFIFFVVV